MDRLQAEQAAQQPGFGFGVLPQVEQMTQRIGSCPENRLQVEKVARLPGLAHGVAVLVGVVAQSVC